MTLNRERSYLRRFSAASKVIADDESPGLFDSINARERRRVHLTFVVRRLISRLQIAEPEGIDTMSADELDALRIRLAQQLPGVRIAA